MSRAFFEICASCVALVEQAILKVLGVLRASVHFAAEHATVLALSIIPVSALSVAVQGTPRTSSHSAGSRRTTCSQ